MFAKLFICGLLFVSVTQASPAPVVKSEEKELICLEKLQWYRDVTNTTKKLYNEYLKHVEDAGVPSGVINSDQIEDIVGQAMKKYDSDMKDLGSIDDNAAKDRLCEVVINSYKTINANLTQLAIDHKSMSLGLIEFSAQKNAKDDLNKTLSALVNFLFIVDLNNYPYKEVPTLLKKCTFFTENGVELEKEWKLKSNGEVEISDDLDTINYDDDKDMIETKKKDKALDKQIMDAEKDLSDREAKIKSLDITKADEDDDDDEIYLPGKWGFLERMIHSNPTLAAVLISLLFLSMLVSLLAWVARQWNSRTRYSTFT